MSLNPTSWKWFTGRQETVPVDEVSPLDDLLFRIEFSDDADERAALQKELEELVAGDEEAARMYEMHRMLERELEALFESGVGLRRKGPWARVKGFFVRLRCRFSPGPVG